MKADLSAVRTRAAYRLGIFFGGHILGQSEPFDLTANECEERAINRLANYEMLSVEEKLDALKDTRELLRIANAKRWREHEEFPRRYERPASPFAATQPVIRGR